MVLDDSAVVTAPSVEEAIILGLTRLVATRDEVEIEVLDEGSRGFLGIGAREARVRLVRKQGASAAEVIRTSHKSAVVEESVPPAQPAVVVPHVPPATVPATPVPPASAPPATVPQHRPAEARQQSRTAADAAGRDTHKPKRTAPPSVRKDVVAADEDLDLADRLDQEYDQPDRKPGRSDEALDREGLSRLAEEMVANMLPGLAIEAAVEWVDEDRPTLWISLTGHDADALVGPRARNLHALQYLLRALLYHQSDGNYNVVVDADGYRKRRRRSLETMAKAKADQAVAEGHMVRLRAMPPHERRIIHIILREDDRVTTESVGKGRDRAVTIVPRSASEPK